MIPDYDLWKAFVDETLEGLDNMVHVGILYEYLHCEVLDHVLPDIVVIVLEFVDFLVVVTDVADFKLDWRVPPKLVHEGR